jgi:hypothetical protein
MQERRLVFAIGPRADEITTRGEQAVDRLQIAFDNGVSGALERREIGLACGDRFDVVDKLRPARESVCTSDDELRLRERAVGRDQAVACVVRYLTPFPINGATGCVWGLACTVEERGNPLSGPRADGVGALAAGLRELFRTLAVLIEIGMLRKWKDALRIRIHTNLLSRTPGVRTDQAERRFVSSTNDEGGHCPFRGLIAPLALRPV